MAMMVWISIKIKDGNKEQVLKMMDQPEGNSFTFSQKGCERLERSVDHENSNHVLLTELWSSKEDWDAYFAIRMKEIEEGGFFSGMVPLLEEDGLKITFSEINKSL